MRGGDFQGKYSFTASRSIPSLEWNKPTTKQLARYNVRGVRGGGFQGKCPVTASIILLVYPFTGVEYKPTTNQLACYSFLQCTRRARRGFPGEIPLHVLDNPPGLYPFTGVEYKPATKQLACYSFLQYTRRTRRGFPGEIPRHGLLVYPFTGVE